MSVKKTSKTESGSRKRAPNGKGNSREKILEEATRLFANFGYENVTIRDIEKVSGVGAPTIYYFFKDKRNLYRESVINSYEQIRESIFYSTDKAMTPEEKIRYLCKRHIDAFSEDKAFIKLYSREILDDDNDLKRHLAEKTLAPALENWREALNQLSPQGGEGPMPFIVTSTLVGMSQSAVFRKYLPYPSSIPDQEAEYELAIEQLISLIMHSADGKSRSASSRGQVERKERKRA